MKLIYGKGHDGDESLKAQKVCRVAGVERQPLAYSATRRGILVQERIDVGGKPLVVNIRDVCQIRLKLTRINESVWLHRRQLFTVIRKFSPSHISDCRIRATKHDISVMWTVRQGHGGRPRWTYLSL